MDKRCRLRAAISLTIVAGGFTVVPEPATSQARALAGGGGMMSAAAPTFSGSADLTDEAAANLFAGFGLVKGDFADGRDISNSVGLIVYDRAAGRIVESYNADRSFNLASTTKLFTMAVVGHWFAGDPLLAQHRSELSDILKASDNRGASLWMRLARQKANGALVDYAAMNRQVKGRCYGDPPRTDEEKTAEKEAARAFFQAHREAYSIDWTGADIVDGAGCERAGMYSGGEDRMTPRQYLTVLDKLTKGEFGGWNAFQLMPKRTLDGAILEGDAASRAAAREGVLAWKTGTDGKGIKAIAGFIPRGGDPYGIYFVMLINSGKSPPGSGLIHGGDVVQRFSRWAAGRARSLDGR